MPMTSSGTRGEAGQAATTGTSWPRLAGCVAVAALTGLLAPAGEARLAAGLGLFVLIGSLWMTQAIHLTITALLVPVMAIVLGLLPPREALAPFAHPIIFLFLGGFALAAALARHGLDQRLAMGVIRLAGGRRPMAVGLLFVLTAGLSMWISNTATAAMMLPLALGLLRSDVPDQEPPGPREHAFVLLGVAYSASLGGIGTLVGSPPNAIAAAQAGISFMGWMAMGLPLVLVLMPLMIGVLALVLRPSLSGQVRMARQADTFEWTPGRVATLAVFTCTVLGWIFGAPVARAIGLDQDVDTLVALCAIVALAAVRALEWDDIEKQTQWGVLLMFGGGLCLGAVMAGSGASRFLADGLLGLVAGAPAWAIVLGVVAFVVLLTELVSNTASAALLIPVFISVAPQLGLEPAVMVAAIAVSASCAFMLPVATPPNAIVFGTGAVPQATMMRCGAALNVVCVAVIAAMVALAG